MNQNLLNLIIFLVVIGGSVAKVIFTKLQEQAAKRKLQLELERRRLEALRTGRETAPDRPAPAVAVKAGPASASQDLEELARRRAAQLQELRRLQQQRQAGMSNTPATRTPSGPISRIPGSSGPTVPGTRPPPPRRAPQFPPKPKAPARSNRQESRPQNRSTPQRPKPQPLVGTSPPLQEPAPALRPPATPGPDASERPARPRSMFGAHAHDWRRALIMSEILSSPLAMRTSEPGPLRRQF